MDHLDSEYQSILRGLGRSDKAHLEDDLSKQTSVENQDIELQIRRDKEHLTVVNFCIGKFSAGSYIASKTGYLWIRVDPLYGSRGDDGGVFDIAIYNSASKVLILVECKSSLREARRELGELEKKIDTTSQKKSLLEDMVGEEIALVEFTLCVKAGEAPAAKPLIKSRNIPCCLWSADIFGDILVLEKLTDDSPGEISAGRLHHDNDLRGFLLNGSYEKSALRSITFLPSSHMSTILEEVIPQLKIELDRNSRDEFDLRDMRTLMTRELSLQNFEDLEKLGLAEKALHSAPECGIVDDKTRGTENFHDKRFSISNQTPSFKRLIDDCHNKYVSYHARQKALTTVIKRFRERHYDLSKYLP